MKRVNNFTRLKMTINSYVKSHNTLTVLHGHLPLIISGIWDPFFFTILEIPLRIILLPKSIELLHLAALTISLIALILVSASELQFSLSFTPHFGHLATQSSSPSLKYHSKSPCYPTLLIFSTSKHLPSVWLLLIPILRLSSILHILQPN